MTRSPRVGVRRSHLSVWLVVLVNLGVALASALLVGGARSASQPQGLIAFARNDGIYVMPSDGQQVRALRRGGVAAQARCLAWSPDASRLAFVSTDDAVWVMNADGSELVRVLGPAQQSLAGSNWSPTWLPNGRQIAVTVFNGDARNPDRDIWVVNVDGSGLHRLLQTPRRFEREIDWSPVGGRVAFGTGGWVPRIFVMSTNGRNARDVTGPVGAIEPDWSPDGRRIVYGRGRYGFGASDDISSAEIFVVNVRRGSRLRLTRNAAADFDPAWSPDGSQIVFVRNTSDPWETCDNCPPPRRGSGELYVMNADGTGVRRLTKNNVAEESPAWQPVAAP